MKQHSAIFCPGNYPVFTMPAHGVSPHSLMPPSRMPKAIFFRPSKSRKDPILKTEKKNLSLCWVIFLLLSPQIFCYIFLFCFFSDCRISRCLISKKLRTQEWNKIEYQTLLNKTYQTGRMLGIWEIHVFINISNYVWYYVCFNPKIYSKYNYVLYEIQAHLKKEISASLSYK